VHELDGMKEYLHKIVPSAKICVGHGQMGQKELDDTIIDFLDQKYNVLLCTTIIETGLDMPNVNTIFVQNANEFGLAQLYQLRGRVGRRATRGFAYFLMSPNVNEDSEGMQRLNILREHQELGSGFVIASHDLEMRGAGNILGDEQSGKVSEVGLETYTQLLDNAIRSMGGIKVKAATEAEINIPVPHQIPEEYIQNSKERLRTYRRFFAASTEDQLRNLVAECEDRFGPLPESVRSLSELSRIRRWLISMNAIGLIVTDSSSEIRMSPDIFQASEDGSNEQIVKRILEVTNVAANRIRLTPDGRMLLPVSKKNFSGPSPSGFSEIKRFLSQLNGEVLTPVTISSTAGEPRRK
jgi:transcription-repair coupling factor (superfamily II helicase)